VLLLLPLLLLLLRRLMANVKKKTEKKMASDKNRGTDCKTPLMLPAMITFAIHAEYKIKYFAQFVSSNISKQQLANAPQPSVSSHLAVGQKIQHTAFLKDESISKGENTAVALL
jgi:hypothetical protein